MPRQSEGALSECQPTSPGDKVCHMPLQGGPTGPLEGAFFAYDGRSELWTGPPDVSPGKLDSEAIQARDGAGAAISCRHTCHGKALSSGRSRFRSKHDGVTAVCSHNRWLPANPCPTCFNPAPA